MRFLAPEESPFTRIAGGRTLLAQELEQAVFITEHIASTTGIEITLKTMKNENCIVANNRLASC